MRNEMKMLKLYILSGVNSPRSAAPQKNDNVFFNHNNKSFECN